MKEEDDDQPKPIEFHRFEHLFYDPSSGKCCHKSLPSDGSFPDNFVGWLNGYDHGELVAWIVGFKKASSKYPSLEEVRTMTLKKWDEFLEGLKEREFDISILEAETKRFKEQINA